MSFSAFHAKELFPKNDCEDHLVVSESFFLKWIRPSDPKNMHSRSGEEQLVPSVLTAIHGGDWEHPLLNQNLSEAGRGRTSRLLFEGYNQKKISLHQLSTFLFRNAVIHALLDHKNMLTDFSAGFFSTDGHGRKRLTKAQLLRFEAKLRVLPLSERNLWSIKIAKSRPYDPQKPWFKEIESINALSISRHGDYDDDRFLTLFVPSIGVLQAYMDVKFGSNAVQLQPTLGVTSTVNILEGISAGGRILSLPFDGVEGMLNGDDLCHGQYMVAKHDISHALDGSKHSQSLRMSLAILARDVEDMLQGSSTEPAPCAMLYEGIPLRYVKFKYQGQIIKIRFSETLATDLAELVESLRFSSSDQSSSSSLEADFKMFFSGLRFKKVSNGYEIEDDIPGRGLPLLILDLVLHPQRYLQIPGFPPIEEVIGAFGESTQQFYRALKNASTSK